MCEIEEVGDWAIRQATDCVTLFREELEGYAEELVEKPEIVALSKADQLLPEMVEEQRQILEKGIGKKVYIVSGATHEGLKEIHREIRAYIEGERERRAMEGREDEGFQP